MMNPYNLIFLGDSGKTLKSPGSWFYKHSTYGDGYWETYATDAMKGHTKLFAVNLDDPVTARFVAMQPYATYGSMTRYQRSGSIDASYVLGSYTSVLGGSGTTVGSTPMPYYDGTNMWQIYTSYTTESSSLGASRAIHLAKVNYGTLTKEAIGPGWWSQKTTNYEKPTWLSHGLVMNSGGNQLRALITSATASSFIYTSIVTYNPSTLSYITNRTINTNSQSAYGVKIESFPGTDMYAAQTSTALIVFNGNNVVGARSIPIKVNMPKFRIVGNEMIVSDTNGSVGKVNSGFGQIWCKYFWTDGSQSQIETYVVGGDNTHTWISFHMKENSKTAGLFRITNATGDISYPCVIDDIFQQSEVQLISSVVEDPTQGRILIGFSGNSVWDNVYDDVQGYRVKFKSGVLYIRLSDLVDGLNVEKVIDIKPCNIYSSSANLSWSSVSVSMSTSPNYYNAALSYKTSEEKISNAYTNTAF